MIKAIIIDDEQHAVEIISVLLKSFEKEIDIVGTANSVANGITIINKLEPDIVFLDIEMKDGSGFEVVEKTSHQKYKLVFTTAYDQYAIKAFKVRALDYLLKPIDLKEFDTTVKRFIEDLNTAKIEKTIKPDERIKVPDGDGYQLIHPIDILYLAADSNYTRLYTRNGRSYIMAKTLKEFESKLDTSIFTRVHHSYIVNNKEIIQISKGEPATIKLSTGQQIPVSRSKKNNLNLSF